MRGKSGRSSELLRKLSTLKEDVASVLQAQPVIRQFQDGHLRPGRLLAQLLRADADEYDDFFSIILCIDASSPESLLDDCKEFILTYSKPISLETDEDVKRAFKDFFAHHGHWLIIFDGADYNQRSNCSQKQWENLWNFFPSDRNGTIIVTTTSELDSIMGIKPIYVPPFTTQEVREFATSRSLSPPEEQLLIDYGGCTPLSLMSTLYVIWDIQRDHGPDYDPINNPDFMKEFMMKMRLKP